MITVRLKGGQGNQMFQYAFGRALALRNNDKLQLDLAPLLDRTPRPNFIFRNYDIDVFNIDEHLTLLSRVALKFPVPVLWAGLSVIVTFIKKIFWIQRFVRETRGFDPEKIPHKGNFYLDGAWQSEKYFTAIAPVIRKEFTLREPLSFHAKALADDISRGESIAVNVRRADFVNLDRSIKAHGFVGVEYYEKAMAEMKKHVRGGRVYVFSDEIEWCRENLKFEKMETTYVGHEFKGKKFEEYLYLMSLAKHFIIPNSTFGWWGAWLSANPDKIVIAPQQWFKDGRSDEGLVPSSWKRI